MADMGVFRNAVADWAADGDGGPAGEPAAEPAAERAARLAAELGVASVVLVEGPSDLAAVETLAARLDRDLPAEGVCVVSMGGAMNVGRYARLLGPPGLGLRLTGLCDEREHPYFDRGFQRAGAPRHEVFVCVADLEEELIRALGAQRVEGVIEAEGDLVPWQTFVRQPAQRGRDPHHRMRRFLGTKKGRKIRYGHLLTQALDLGLLPTPLDALLTALGPARAGR
ncbi:TOPRIM nucleotidyl transferase/hydrolase domain-containing protein [Streptomyces sp. NPDC058734]|uniref:TOPRIM nucleotidyl transferase/hydrolase domain-containing protein n=1 Tax=Streptomyces sp. NPDC058734 TaxID=3346615 RepID=UPI0036797642